MEITLTKCLHCNQVIPGESVKDHPCFTLTTEASCINCRAWISGYLMCECQTMRETIQEMKALEERAWNAYQAEQAIEPVRDPMTGVADYAAGE